MTYFPTTITFEGDWKDLFLTNSIEFSNDNNVLHNSSSGFRRNHSRDLFLSFLNNKNLEKYTGMILIDLQKTFVKIILFSGASLYWRSCKSCLEYEHLCTPLLDTLSNAQDQWKIRKLWLTIFISYSGNLIFQISNHPSFLVCNT